MNPWLGLLAFRTTLKPLFPQCEVAKFFFACHSPLLWLRESIETIEAILPVPALMNSLCTQRDLSLMDLDINCHHYSLFQSFPVNPILVASVRYGKPFYGSKDGQI